MAGAAKISDDTDLEQEDEAAEPAPRKKGKGLIIAVAGLLLAAAGGGAYYFLGGRASPAAGHGTPAEAPAGGEHGDAHGAAPKSGTASYLSLDPAFVVNLADAEAMRFMQVDVQVMAHDSKVTDAVKLHMPRIRNSLILLFGQQHFQDLNSREGKELLQKKALEEIQKVLQAETGAPGVEAVYFTSFVMQ